jgi:hypothetical protein
MCSATTRFFPTLDLAAGFFDLALAISKALSSYNSNLRDLGGAPK